MKKYFAVFLFLMCVSLYATDFNYSPLLSDINDCNGKFRVYMYTLSDKEVTRYIYDDGELIFSKKYNFNFQFDSGYSFITYNAAGNSYRDYYIIGDGIIIVNSKDDEPIKKESLSIYDKYLQDNWEQIKNNSLSSGALEKTLYYVVDDGIKNIYASSYLTEGNIKYEIKNVLNRLYLKDDIEYCGYWFDSITVPWVEGKSDYGIGETIQIEFDKPSDMIQILNGFVDTRRMYLYKENSRLKVIKIESVCFSMTYSFEDVVKFSTIILPEKVSSVKITILDVYEGTKYSDTCISSILVRTQEELQKDFNEFLEKY